MANDIKQDLFFVRRNTNRSEVHYQISAAGTEPITVFEQMAFGIARQRVEGSGVFFHLTAIAEREIRVEHSRNPECLYAAHISINKCQATMRLTLALSDSCSPHDFRAAAFLALGF